MKSHHGLTARDGDWDWVFYGWGARCVAIKRDGKRCTRHGHSMSREEPDEAPLCGHHRPDRGK